MPVFLRGGWLLQCAGGLLGLCCASCSLIAERPPPSEPSQRTARAAAHCSDIGFPIADTLSTIAAGTWIFYANRKIDENEPKPGGPMTNQFGGVDEVPPSSGDPSAVTGYKWLRAGGYAGLALFGASAIYGWVIEAKCHEFRQELKTPQSKKAPQVASTLPSFPTSVLGFGFDFRPARAKQYCSAQGRSWSLEANVGRCHSTAGNPDVRLDFELGLPARITVVYRAPAQRLANDYRELDASMRKIYGAPQIDPPLSSSCAASLVDCLKNDELPRARVWQWPRGSIELTPVQNADEPVLELTYMHSEPEAP